ncbi:hypothetical protein [Bacillus cereus]|nr:hypothetical protein [Bacillus cereus]
MNNIFLSLLNIETASEIKYQDYIEKFKQKRNYDEDPLYWLFKDNEGNLSQFHNVDLQKKINLKHSDIPVFRKLHSDILLELLSTSNIFPKVIDILCYCHETIENSHSILPVLKAKKKIGLKSSLPFSIGHAGSLNSAIAIELAIALLNGNYENFLLTIVDSVIPPFSRFSFNGYIKGDGATSILLNKNKGDYKVKDVKIYPSSLNKDLSNWGIEEYLESEKLIIAKYKDLLDDINSSKNSVKFVLYQNLSNKVDCKLEEINSNISLNTIKRLRYAEVNLLGSDIFYSLKELEEKNILVAGDVILLVSASIDHGIAGIVLEKT